MANNQSLINLKVIRFLGVICLISILSLTAQHSLSTGKAAVESVVVRRVNVPYLGPEPPVQIFTPAIFWFGKVENTSNYADVRTWYYDNYIKIVVHVIDRKLWYDPSPSASDLTSWDSISLYLKLDGNNGPSPTNTTYRIDAQINDYQSPRTNWQTAFRGNGSGWVTSTIPYTTESGYVWESTSEGGINNNQNNRGWEMNFIIPFNSLGYSTRPNTGTIWGLALSLHDRDDQIGTSIPDQTWPETMQPDQPSSWGQMHFGTPVYSTPSSIQAGTVTIRHGLNGSIVKDGEVGGHTTCSEDLWPNIFTTFGQANYDGYDQINIQNQWNLSDWSCFSKFYITFPLSAIPAGRPIISATLSMYLFGGSAGNPDSYIQAFSVDKDWLESTLTWNNAPLAVENITGTWVHPIPSRDWVQYNWDVSRAVAQAYSSGQPLRLALYSADGDFHTGKYFISSDGQDVGRPTLRIDFGSPCINCPKTFIPIVNR